ncbi:hypothetical protein [Thiomicrorhabdus lithotrophica]|uniref:Uncharacterized protein n=1 Tax=Thiomicrorhabdus lithotrophica TaxID=2949997 RepID=A0ABY8C8V3_9GAMM|nr:hypothetical protein [Thiomicrorhabdus lithotrophica]WEJ61977.1 hypothetical protein NR989_08120 [Thiomicrorhabdus lithotrophica]
MRVSTLPGLVGSLVYKYLHWLMTQLLNVSFGINRLDPSQNAR